MCFGIPNHIPARRDVIEFLNPNAPSRDFSIPPSRDVIGYDKTHTISITTRLAGMCLYDRMHVGIPNHLPLTCT